MPTAGKGRDRRHARNRAQAAAAQPLQQHGLELVVGMMRRQQRLAGAQSFGEHPVTGRPGSSLGTLARTRPRIDTNDFAVDAERSRDGRAVPGPSLRIPVQAVIDVDGSHGLQQPAIAATGQVGKPRQQDGRIEAAAQRDARPGGRPRNPGECVLERSPQTFRRKAHRGSHGAIRRPARAVARSGARATDPRATGRPRAGDGSGPPQGRPPSPAGRGARRRAVRCRISSTRPSLSRRSAVMPIASAAISFLSALFHRIDAQPSGEITE